ncbi:S1C family serine protease [Pseudomonas chlororaphis]|uniref:Serine protease n=1 Tax=Pseudomonas chlororaphis subsp. aurantiaca TaxID=86192 RepID=A0AAJ0ZIW5_9PSED|nr:S1C family serine protease [Pseudomonas chlororaphis]MBU4633460.1 serine protease [Pseudomonas chlororaphis subsp. aurantiaca]
MASYKSAVLGVALIALSGCNGTLSRVASDEMLPGYFPVNSIAYLFQASAIQWNQHYAVSVAHIPLLTDVVYRCSTGCDLVFLRHEADGALPIWRSAVVGETVKTVGKSPLLITVKGTGTHKASKARLGRTDDDTVYALNDAPVAQGMSGGPVYGRDGAVLGMTVGIFQAQSSLPSALKNNQRLSAYLPYEIIQREWRLFTERQADALCQPHRTDNLLTKS